MSYHLTEIKEMLGEMRADIKEIKRDIKSIKKDMNRTMGACVNMDDHISFIDGIYDTLIQPMNYILSKTSSSSSQLAPKHLIKDKTSDGSDDDSE